MDDKQPLESEALVSPFVEPLEQEPPTFSEKVLPKAVSNSGNVTHFLGKFRITFL